MRCLSHFTACALPPGNDTGGESSAVHTVAAIAPQIIRQRLQRIGEIALHFAAIGLCGRTKSRSRDGRLRRGYLPQAERVRCPRAEGYGPLPGSFGHQLAGTTAGAGGAFPGLGQAGAGNARLANGLEIRGRVPGSLA